MAQRNLKRMAAGLVLGALASASAGALADERTEARAHFKKGMSEIADGNYDRGIEELKKAYDILPHPNVLYNIARAYVDQGDLGERRRLLQDATSRVTRRTATRSRRSSRRSRRASASSRQSCSSRSRRRRRRAVQAVPALRAGRPDPARDLPVRADPAHPARARATVQAAAAKPGAPGGAAAGLPEARS